MLVEQVIEFQLRSLGPLAVYYVLLQLVISMTKQKSRCKFSSRLFFIAKILQDAMYLTSPLHTWAKLLTKCNPKMQGFKRVLNLS